MNDSNSFCTVDYVADKYTEIDLSFNHVFKSTTNQELNTLHHISEIERTQLLEVLALFVQNLQLAGYLYTGNRSNFLYVEIPTAWLFDFPRLHSLLYETDKCFDRIPINYQHTVMCIDKITGQNFN